MDSISIGARESLKHLPPNKQKYVIEITKKYKEYWEETIEYVEKTEERNIRRYIRIKEREIKNKKQ